MKYDRFFGRGGFCRLRDRSYFILNERLSNEAKAQIFINELRSFDTDNGTVSDQIRKLTEVSS
ncbi:MAG: hypothetical protein JSW02_09560 [candidate division WOR-3 bacterium]|nr:MAG: hypothetical protein JSW02_09560 [candidate division WOR-3 bacterium]